MSDSRFAKKIKELAVKQLESSSAQRLIEKLSLIKNRREDSRKRWFWELMQNASDYNDSVNLDLVVTDTTVSFSHDGLPFQKSDIIDLIRPNSNKQDDTRRKDLIGKFGSGFVSTHILSSHVRIEGIVVDDDDNSMREFKIDLNRSHFEDKKRLLNDIQETIEQIGASAKLITKGKSLNTSFTYYLKEPLPGIIPLKSQDVDLRYLYEVLPYTLCFMPKIKSVRIIDKRGKKEKLFTIKRSDRNEENVIIFNIDNGGRTLEECKMVIFQSEEASSAIRINEGKVLSYPKDMARLFCGLPLVGSERTGLPIIVNSLKFEPTTEREGVEIDPSCDKQNISILKSAIDLYDIILEYVEENQLQNGYEIARINNEYNGTFESKENFKDHFVDLFKDVLLPRCIAQNVNGSFICVEELRIPYKDRKVNKELYSFALKLDPESLPKDYPGWAKSLEKFEDFEYTYEDLAWSISAKTRLDKLDKQKRNAEKWLKECVTFLLKCDKNICSDYRILPNQSGDFKYIKDLSIDKRLPAELKRINEKTEYDSLSSKLLNRSFNTIIQADEYTVCMLAQRIDDNIKDIYIENDSTIPQEYEETVSSLYSWIRQCGLDEEDLKKYFPWFYPKQASIIADMMTDEERSQSLKIVRSGKMAALASLAESSLSVEQIQYIAENSAFINHCLIAGKVDDVSYANPNEGELGESIVYKELKKIYPNKKGYQIVWASRDRNEPCYDFEILKNGETLCYYDAKTTSRGLNNSDSIPLFLRKSQWIFLSALSDNTPYYIARVFLADNNRIRFLRLSLKQ